VKLDSSYEHPLIAKLPLEIKSGTVQAALNYVRDLRYGSISCYRSKVVFVGFPGVGKTSLSRSLCNLIACFGYNGLFGAKWQATIFSRGPSLVIAWESGFPVRLFLDSSYFIEKKNKTLCIRSLVQPRNSIHVFIFTDKDADLLAPGRIDTECHLDCMNVDLVFPSDILCEQWLNYAAHWVNNTATTGIETTQRLYPRSAGKGSLELCFMDFAGQREFVG
jgi:GTPase SAR1 family protein